MVWKDAAADLPVGRSSVVEGPTTTKGPSSSYVSAQAHHPRQESTLSLRATTKSEHRDDDGPWTSGSNAVTVSTLRLQCGYERNCSPLYKHIEREEWDGVSCFLDTGYCKCLANCFETVFKSRRILIEIMSAVCFTYTTCTGTHGSLFPDRIPPATQVRTWVCSNSKRTPWSVLPLHLALSRAAPYIVIARLVERTFSCVCAWVNVLCFHYLFTLCRPILHLLFSLPSLGAVQRLSRSFSNRDCRRPSLLQQNSRLFLLCLPRSRPGSLAR